MAKSTAKSMHSPVSEARLIAQSRFKKGDRVQYGTFSSGRVLGHEVQRIDGEPTLTLIVLLDPEHRLNAWTPLESWIEGEQVCLAER